MIPDEMIPDEPIVSVITANYNGAAHLAQAVRSVLAQSLGAFELIIVDDRSSDDSLAVIARAAGGDPRVRVLVQRCNGGPAAARNRALAAARGRWIAVFDSDDLMDPARLQRLVESGEAAGADIVVDNLLVFEDGADAAPRPFLPLAPDAAPRWIELEAYVGASRLYARKPGLGYLKPLFRARALGGLRYREDLRIGEDYDLVLRLLLKGARLRLEPQALYRYRKHGGSISHRLRPEHIERMLAADADLAAAFERAAPAVRRQQRARTRSLQRGLVYDAVIGRLKARRLLAAAALGLRSPGVWPLLTLPLQARARRLTAALTRRPSAAAGHALA